MTDITEYLNAIGRRHAQLQQGSAAQRSFEAHLRSLARWYDEPVDYPDPGPIPFPEVIFVAYAVCHPECGCREFIVEGSTQECQYCGSLMYRAETHRYVRSGIDLESET